MLEEIKTILGISHTKFDSEITSDIAVARAELIRSGVTSTKANSLDDTLINKAIKSYCCSQRADNEKLADGYRESWLYQVENLRKSKGYRVGDEVV